MHTERDGTGSAAAGRGGEIRALTGLRIVAAAWVVVYHFPWREDAAFAGVWDTFRWLIAPGWLGVDVFFVLSGFVIAHTYLDTLGPRLRLRPAVEFLWARICRIWPLWALVTVGFWLWLLAKSTVVADGAVAYQRVQPDLGVLDLVEQLLMVQLWHGPSLFGTSYVGPGWSVSAEWAAYCAFPLLVLAAWRCRRLPAWVSGALAVGAMLPFAYLCYRTGTPTHDWIGLGRIAAGFAAGVLTCLAVRRLPRGPRTARAATVVVWAVLVEAAIVVVWATWRAQDVPGVDHYGVLVPLIPVLVGALALSQDGVAGFLARPAMVLGGRISYALYLVHMCLFEVGRTVMDRVPAFADGTALGTLLLPQLLFVSVALAYVLHRWVEEPARRRLRGRGPGRWAQGPRVPADGADRPTVLLRHEGTARRVPAPRARERVGTVGPVRVPEDVAAP
ncbi:MULTISPECIES: acyltransferase family protein [unclassified Blastococcus]